MESKSTVLVLGENRTLAADGSVFRDDFRKLGVHIYEIAY